MRHQVRIAALALLAVAALGCAADGDRIDDSDDGGIILSIAGFGTIPLTMSASASSPFFQIDSMTVRSIVKNPGLPTSQLMVVELQGYEVTYERLDNGTRLPPRFVERIVGTVDPGGTFELLNGPVFGVDQFNNQPLEDMLDFGLDTETDSTVIRVKVGIRFFGKTIAGDTIETQVAHFSLDILP